MSSHTHTSGSIRGFAASYPLFFALLYFVVYLLVLLAFSLVGPRIVPFVPQNILYLVEEVVQALLALVTLAWLGWLRVAGFNRRSEWRNLRVLWLPILFALLYLLPIFFIPISSPALAAFAVIYAIGAGINEEAAFRGVVLQALRPYGFLAAAALSGLLFALVHANNFLNFAPVMVIAQILSAFFLGFAFAIFRLLTRTIWPLIIIHSCFDVAVNLGLFAAPHTAHSSIVRPSSLLFSVALVIPSLILAAYALFWLRAKSL